MNRSPFLKLLTIGVASVSTLAAAPDPKAPHNIAPQYGFYTVDASPAQPTPDQVRSQGEVASSMIVALQAAKNFVEAVDAGNFASSWDQGDQMFQKTVSKQEWVTALGLAKEKLGALKSRTLKDEKPAWDPAGLPKGSYMVVEYNTSFEKVPQTGELLTLHKGDDGKWRVLTYQVN